MSPARPHSKAGWTVLLVVVMFVLATVFPATKSVTDELSPLSISFFRCFFGVLPLVPLYVVERRRVMTGRGRPGPTAHARRAEGRDRWMMGLLGVPGIALSSICLTFGIKLSTAYNGSLLANSQPIFTTLLAPLIIKEDFSPLRLAGSLSGVAGVALVVAAGGNLAALGSLATQQFLWGNLILVGGALSISVYTILLKREGIRGVQWLTLLYSVVIGTAFVHPMFDPVSKSAKVAKPLPR